MKTTFGITLLAAAVVFTAACRMTADEGGGAVKMRTVTFSTEAPGTRTAFLEPEGDRYPAVWQSGDEVKVLVNDSEINPTTDKGIAEAKLSEDGRTASFSVSVPDPGTVESLNFSVLSPASAYAGRGTETGSSLVTIPTEQCATPHSPDPRAMLLCAFSGPYGDVPKQIKLQFLHLTAYGCLRLNGLPEGETLQSVTLQSDRTLAGQFAAAPISATLYEVQGERRVTISCKDADAVWFACAPGDWSGSTLELTAVTTGGSYTVTRTLPSDREMKAGQIARITVDLGGASGKTDVFDENQIVFSFGAISDTHVSGISNDSGNKLAAALRQLKARAQEHDADGLDAVVVAGDVTDHPGQAVAESGYFKTIYEGVFDPAQVPMIYTIGNHDVNPGYAWSSNTVSQARQMSDSFGARYFLYDQDPSMRENFECRDCLVDGYHVLCITPNSDQPIGFHGNVVFWLDERLKTLTEADPDRYVFVNTHPMIENTVYGSLLGAPSTMDDIWQSAYPDYWATRALTEVLSKYPQAVTFSGHLHFPLHDPRSIWQGAFTSFGCGSVYYMAIENGKYENMRSATVMEDSYEVSDGWLIQLDRSGNMRATALDFSNNAVIAVPYEIPYPHADKSHLSRYGSNRAESNQAPVLDASQLQMYSRQVGSMSSTVVEWAKARDDEFVHHYELKVRKGGSEIVRRKYLADFYLHPQASGMKDRWSVSLGSLTAGTYEVSLTAYDSWDASTSVNKSFTIEGPEPMQKGLYADIDFDGGTAHDSKGKVTVTNKGATFAETAVTHAGQSYTVPAMRAGLSKYVECQFNEIASFAEARAFMSEGFSIEAMFVDREPGTVANGNDGIHGVFCGTQYGGWGMALRATKLPYFIVGEDSKNHYVTLNAGSSISSTDLTHVVCVYDPSAMKATIYLNGSASASKSISGSFYPGDGKTFNRFCLGADISETVVPDFPCTDMLITDAKFYVGALDATAVQAAYQSAVQALNQQ